MSLVETYQNEWELGQLMGIVQGLAPRKILEVGAMYGGTLWHWMRYAELVVVVDDEMRNAAAWEEWADEVELCLLQGQSQDPALVEQARIFGPYDFAFIDASHTFDAVKADWENYGPLAKVVAFHDILPRPNYGVSELWTMFKAQPGARYVEIAHTETLPGNEGPCGIGVLWT